MNSGRLRAGIVIALIIVCSALAGAAIERVRSARHRPLGGLGGPGGPGGPGRFTREQDTRHREEVLDRMTKDLDLSATQRASIDSILQHSDSSLRAIRVEMQPRLRVVFDSSRANIEARLTPEQREKFEKLRPQRPRR